MKIILVILLSTFIVSCSSTARFNKFNDSNPNNTQNIHNKESSNTNAYTKNNSYSSDSQLIKQAKNYLGTPYKWGGTTKDGIDCSAFVQNVYKSIGINLPRTSKQQYKYIANNRVNSKQTGDLVFFKKGREISHVAIYIGDNKIIHASSKKGVIIQDLDNYYLQKRYYTTCRVIQ